MKSHAFCRFDLVIGTAGVAGMVICPALANDVPSIYYTTAAYALSSAGNLQPFATAGSSTVASTLNNGWTSISHNGPFTGAQLTDGITDDVSAFANGRIVCAGARAQYTGTTLNESGLYYGYHDPAHSSLSGIAPTAIGAFGDTNIVGVTRKPFMLPLFGTSEKEMVFSLSDVTGLGGTTEQLYPLSNGNYQWSNAYASNSSLAPYISVPSLSPTTYYQIQGAPIGVFAVTGVAGQTVHIEYVSHMEFVGQAASSMLTPVHADVEGTQVVRTAALQVPAMKIAQPNRTPWQLMYSALGAAFDAVKPMAVPLLESAFTALFM
jgi:hypothetical protein